jgi:uncharacterized protein (DUF1501 family)
MNGGNDGLNTVFPLDKWTNLNNARSNILMNQSSVLPLANNATTGLHPAMSEMKNLHDNGKLMIVQGCPIPIRVSVILEQLIFGLQLLIIKLLIVAG